jgi:GntR family transcriptional regulator, transcriptional repressor for pyruvate dehydrogenase complex
MSAFKPIRQSRVSEEVAEQLKQSILRGEFEPGAKLPSEQRLSEQFKVSRLSVREALHKLESLGFVVTRQGIMGGAYVIDLNFQYLANAFLDLFLAGKISIPELHQLRVVIEPEIARLAALAITPEHAKRLQEAYKIEETTPHSFAERFDRKTAVHQILAQICGNRFFEAIIKSAVGLTTKYVTIVDIGQEHLDMLHPTSMHGPIVDAVVAGDPDLAYSAMKHHALEFGKVLLDLEKFYHQKKSSRQSKP